MISKILQDFTQGMVMKSLQDSKTTVRWASPQDFFNNFLECKTKFLEFCENKCETC